MRLFAIQRDERLCDGYWGTHLAGPIVRIAAGGTGLMPG
jgi:hypothetical protein